MKTRMCLQLKMKICLEKFIRIFKFFQVIFFQIMFEGIKIGTTLECVRVVVPEGRTSESQSTLSIINPTKRIF